MADRIPIIAPDLGATESPRVSAWLVEVGETVRAGDRVVELLLPGVTVDVAAPVSGRLSEATVPLNSAICAGQKLGTIEQDDDV
ncbi:MAG: biotin attachment protein [Planctomycetota bacterium]|nr:biotin attachment protein [Planctomycetaceae bacterium]MDQ3330284.1 biotin attachment protein [Planctomycetota bacterium]